MICEKCGGLITTESARFCPHCGTSVQTTPSITCKVCGKALANSSVRFCPYCGSSTQEEKPVMVCPECAREYEDGFLYCEDCGRRLQPKQDTSRDSVFEKLNGLSYYEGEPTFSAKGILGNLQISSKELVFKVLFAGPLGGGFLAAGKEIAFEMSQVKSVCAGKYGSVFPTLVLEMKNGKKYTFASSVPGSSAAIEKAITAIKRCI